MAEENIAEERLCLFTSVDYTISDTKDGVSFEGKIAPHKANIFTRAEAIKKMAKSLYTHTWKSKTPMVRVQNWEIGVTDQNKKKYLGLAEAALNALLEGEYGNN